MFKIIEIETNKNNGYTVEIRRLNADNSIKTYCNIYYNVTESQLNLICSFNGTFKTVKKILNNCINQKVNGEIIKITEY